MQPEQTRARRKRERKEGTIALSQLRQSILSRARAQKQTARTQIYRTSIYGIRRCARRHNAT